MHARSPTSSVFALSCTPKKNRVFEMNSDSHTSTHTMLITQVSCLCLSFSKAIETWGWWTQPWSKAVVLGLKTWQRKTTHSVKRCVCSESGITNDTAVRRETTITERCSHVFPCRAANPTDGNRNLLLRKVFLVSATTVARTTGLNFNCELCGRWEYNSFVAYLKDGTLMFPT